MSLKIALSALILFAGQACADTIYDFRFFQVCPNCSTGTGGINNSGTGVAAWNDTQQGYLVVGGTVTAVHHPDSPLTFLAVPQNDGRIPGGYVEPTTGALVPTVLQTDGSFVDYPGFPGAVFTPFLELNNTGDAVGYYFNDPSDVHGFLYQGGAYTTLDYPGEMPGDSTFLLGLNESGVYVGGTGNLATSTEVGVIRNPDGSWQTLQYPGSDSTIIWGINNPGTIVGGYRDVNGWHPFLYDGGTFSTFALPGFTNGAVTGINDLGWLIGNTIAPGTDAFGGPQTGFLATPVPEPAAAWLAGIGILAAYFMRRRAR